MFILSRGTTFSMFTCLNGVALDCDGEFAGDGLQNIVSKSLISKLILNLRKIVRNYAFDKQNINKLLVLDIDDSSKLLFTLAGLVTSGSLADFCLLLEAVMFSFAFNELILFKYSVPKNQNI